MMTTEQQRRLAAIAENVDDAEDAARTADMLAQGTLMHSSMDPELLGHISIALQHLQMAQVMLAQAQGETNG